MKNIFVRVRYCLIFLFSLLCLPLTAQKDTILFGINGRLLVDDSAALNFDSLLSMRGTAVLDYQHYKTRYRENDLMYKITDNKGDGFDSLYGTRNMRPILHGAAYRGGANNYYHKTNKRNNHNPLPHDGLSGLCQEGFSNSVYLYRNNFEDYITADTCNCVDSTVNKMDYHQLDYYDSLHVKEMIGMTYDAIIYPEVGPVYLHCWNGWHASGYIAAVLLKQFCDYSSWEAVNYWDLGTDGANTSPRYQHQRERIKKFEPYSEYEISDSLKKCHCPPMPENVDSSQLHIEIEHLMIVPEAIPVGFDIILYNIKFGPGKTTIDQIEDNPDIIHLKKALDKDPNLKIEIGGYTDNSGSTSKNVEISRKRAQFVYSHMISEGYDTSRISYKGYGPAKPAYSNRYKSTREGNRRIEVKILSKTTHDGTQLVNENLIYTKGEDNNRQNYLSYFLNNQNDDRLGSVFIIDSLEFPSNDFTLPTSGVGHQYLLALGNVLLANKGLKININGYTDASGIPEKNELLSEQRARSVYEFLIEQGVNPNRMYYRGFGSNKPIANNRYKWGRDLNRRIEIEFVSD